jgi:hypothetical protein
MRVHSAPSAGRVAVLRRESVDARPCRRLLARCVFGDAQTRLWQRRKVGGQVTETNVILKKDLGGRLRGLARRAFSLRAYLGAPPSGEAHAPVVESAPSPGQENPFPGAATSQDPDPAWVSRPSHSDEVRPHIEIIHERRRRVLVRKGARIYSSMGANAGRCSFAMLDAAGVVVAWHDLDDAQSPESREILGRHVSQFYVPEDVIAGMPERDLSDAASAGGSSQEGWHLRPMGEVFWGLTIIEAIFLRDHRVQGFSFVTRRAPGAVAKFARQLDMGDESGGQVYEDASRTMPVRGLHAPRHRLAAGARA